MSIKDLHVQADGLTEIRKDILESAMQSALLLKNFTLVKSLNRQKKTQITMFKKKLSEISILMSSFKLEDIKEPRQTPKIIKIKPEPVKKEIIKRVVMPKEKTQLEKELDDIQEKLRNLSF